MNISQYHIPSHTFIVTQLEYCGSVTHSNSERLRPNGTYGFADTWHNVHEALNNTFRRLMDSAPLTSQPTKKVRTVTIDVTPLCGYVRSGACISLHKRGGRPTSPRPRPLMDVRPQPRFPLWEPGFAPLCVLHHCSLVNPEP